MLKHVEPSYCKFERPSENMYFYVGTPQNLYLPLFMPRLHSTYDVILDSFQARKWLTTSLIEVVISNNKRKKLFDITVN